MLLQLKYMLWDLIQIHRFLLCILTSAVLCSACQSTKTNNNTLDSSVDPSLTFHEYVIGSEDVLEVNVWKNMELSKTVVVRPDGMITLPLIGDIQAGGRTTGKLREAIRAALEKFKDVPEVTVTVTQVNSYYIYVLGEVRNPGKYQVKSYTTVLQAVALAGGFTEWSEKNGMVILRRSQNGMDQKVKVRYKDVMRDNRSKPDELLRPGDTLIIP